MMNQVINLSVWIESNVLKQYGACESDTVSSNVILLQNVRSNSSQVLDEIMKKDDQCWKVKYSGNADSGNKDGMEEENKDEDENNKEEEEDKDGKEDEDKKWEEEVEGDKEEEGSKDEEGDNEEEDNKDEDKKDDKDDKGG